MNKKNIESESHNSSDDNSTQSSSSMKGKASDKVIYRIQDVPTFDLSKVEFIDKLGEGKNYHSKFINLGAFGKVRLAKMIDEGGLIDTKNKEN